MNVCERGIYSMTKIGVLSDTHITDLSSGLPFLEHLVERYFSDTEMILHAGDLVDPDIVMAFAGRTVHAVRGNMDPAVKGIPNRKLIEVEGFRIGLIHGWGAPDTLESRILREFQGERLDCLVYGHSHQPVCHSKDGVLLFNPGSPTDRRWAPYHSVGVLTLAGGISGEIIPIDA